jgi:hypothetical protein
MLPKSTAQGSHKTGKPGKPGIVREFDKSGIVREMSGNRPNQISEEILLD